MLMDIDLDLDGDRISGFLQSKLDEIKSVNSQLKNSLLHRQKVSAALEQEIEKGFTTNVVQIEQISRKLFDNKYVIFLKLRNGSDTKLEIINVIFDWNSSSPLSYKFYLISSNNPTLLIDGLRCTDHLEQFGQIMVVLEVPYFAHQLSYTITGSINFKHDDKKITLKLPTAIQLTPQDIVDNSMLVHVHKMIDGSIDDFLACALASQKHQFVMVIPDNWTRLLETTLEIDCSLYRVNIRSNKKFFLVEKVCPLLDGALLEVENDELSQNQAVDFNIYCRNRAVLIGLIHYLHKHVTGAIIVPKSRYCPDLSSHDITELIKDSVLDELNRLESISDKDLIKFRSEMATLEHRTDLLVARLNENKK